MATVKVPIQSTAGAIPVKNEKGQISMEKVKVSRYISGKRPQYAQYSSSDEDEEIEFSTQHKITNDMLLEREIAHKIESREMDDRRLRRLQQDRISDEDRLLRSHRLHEPEVVAVAEDEEEEQNEEEEEEFRAERMMPVRRRDDDDERESSEEEEMLDEEEIERRRMMLRERMRQKQQEQEVLDVGEEEVEEGADKAEEEESEYEEYEESEDEDTGPRLKPVFVRKKDRITIQEKESELRKQKELELEAKKQAEERRIQTLKMVENELKKELEEKAEMDKALGGLVTDEENDEEEYEAWKVRELKRLKRDRDEREALEKEKQELERIHNLTEEQRREELRNNPKLVTNKAVKGKYKFLQKYYHRGVFYLDKEEEVFKRDFAQPTLEDHFDKTIVPKVMQVKNFGRSGRTKYTHLVDQDTTVFDSPWIADTAMNLKFHTTKGGGQKQVFERPTAKRK